MAVLMAAGVWWAPKGAPGQAPDSTALLAPVFADARLDSLRLALDPRLQPWAGLPWQPGVTAARRAAAAEGKPVFLIVNTGNVTGFV